MYQPYFRRKKNNVPILSKNEIDEIAEGYVLDFCPEAIIHPQPIAIDLFIEGYLGLTLDYQFLTHNCSYLGMTVFNNTSKIPVYIPNEGRADYYSASLGTIVIDTSLTSDKQLNRYRYTAGHESGHWILHRAYYNYDPNQLSFFDNNDPFVQCRELNRSDFLRDTRTWDDKRWMEWQADIFASCLLMPKTAIRRVCEELQFREESNQLIQITAETFQVSVEAAKYRLSDLKLIESTAENNQLKFSW